MMEEWARTVGPDDTIVHLGDLCYRGNAWFKNMIAPHLTGGRKLLIQGNHDRQRANFYRQCGFKIVRPFTLHFRRNTRLGYPGTLEVLDPTQSGYADWHVSFSHYPWNDKQEGHPIRPSEVRIHGHIHNNGYTRDAYVPFLKNHINLSAEQTKYRPVNLADLLDGFLLGKYADSGTDPSGELSADDVQPKRGL